MIEPEVVHLKNKVTATDHSIGPEEAPVTLLEYGNFECIDCGRSFRRIKEVQQLLGKNLRFVFRNFPNSRTHPHALRAAQGAEAAAKQGKFWEMHDELFTHQSGLADEDLLRYAKRIRLDVNRFRQDLDDASLLDQIQESYQRALFDEHITGTPTFFINDLRYTGSTEVKDLLAAIKQADPEGKIQLPGDGRRLWGVLARIRRKSNP